MACARARSPRPPARARGGSPGSRCRRGRRPRAAASNSLRVSAPAMQPVHCCMSLRVASSMPSSAITSETAKRPPGRRTRAASRSTCGLSPDRLMTQFEMTTSTDSSGSGIASISPLRNSTFSAPALRAFARASAEHLVGHVESVGLAGRSDALRATGARRCRRPSRGRAPSRPRGASATAVGLPQPSEICCASSGTSSRAAVVVEGGAEHVVARNRSSSSAPRSLPRGVALADGLADVVLLGQLSHAVRSSSAPGST